MKKFIVEETKFNYVNPNAELIIVGITPGNSQLKCSRMGKSLYEIKRENAFAGTMRSNLIAMLDYIDVNLMLGISSCASLWAEDFDKVEMTSLLKDAIYIMQNGKKKMFNDVSKINESKELWDIFNNGFVKDCEQYQQSKLFVACGKNVYDMLLQLKEKGIIKVPIVGIAHPSGANVGRVKCYLGEKSPIDLSYNWCVERMKEAKRIVRKLI